MRWQTPLFWQKKSIISVMLWPVSWGYRLIYHLLRRRETSPYRSKLPLICVGNVVIGGAGKTPTAIALCQLLKEKGYHPAFVSRGYGGSLGKHYALKIDPSSHDAKEVGDEPLLLAKHAPVFIARHRADAVKLAEKHADVDILIMDDGLQNSSVEKQVSLLVIHGEYGVGNGMLFPAGPLREPLSDAFEKADAVLINGTHVSLDIRKAHAKNLPCFHMTLHMTPAAMPDANTPYVAFAGIAHPNRFFKLLTENGYTLCKTLAFADHYPYKTKDITSLQALAKHANASLLTTEKDWVRLPLAMREQVAYVPVSIRFEQKEAFSAWLDTQLQT